MNRGGIQIFEDRNITLHIYTESKAAEVCGRIINSHTVLFKKLLKVLKEKQAKVTV